MTIPSAGSARVYKVTTPDGGSCHFGDYAGALAYARKTGIVECITLTPRDFKIVPSSSAGSEAKENMMKDYVTSLERSLYESRAECESIRAELARVAAERDVQKQEAERYRQGMANWKATAEQKDREFKKHHDQLSAAQREAEEMRKVLPPTDKLRLVARYLDRIDDINGFADEREVQADIRVWADAIDAALAAQGRS